MSVEFYYKEIWEKTLEIFMEDIVGGPHSYDEATFDTFLSKSKLCSLNDELAIISVDTVIAVSILNSDSHLIEQCLQKVLNKNIECKIVHESNVKKEIPFKNAGNIDVTPSYDYKTTNIIPDYTFDNFIIGPCNKESHTAALACALKPGHFYTPLFIFGNSGLGKTHLLHAIGNYTLKNLPDKKVLYTSSTEFVSNVVNTIKNNKIEEFKQSLNQVDILLVDDIQFLAGKEKSHEIFFTIFNELVNNRKQIILTSDRSPAEIKGLEERLISRFSSGLSVGVDSPEFETALAILEKKLEYQSIDPSLVDNEALAYIATNFNKDVRSLEGALNRLIFLTIMSNPEQTENDRIDIKSAIQAFKGQTASSNQELNVYSIKKAVANYYGLTSQQLTSKTRTKNIAFARHIAMYLCRKHLDLSFVKIGEEFGKRDHSTVINGCENIEKKLKNDMSYKIAIQEIEKVF